MFCLWSIGKETLDLTDDNVSILLPLSILATTLQKSFYHSNVYLYDDDGVKYCGSLCCV